MEKKDLRKNLIVKNIKHGTFEQILHTGIMKLESGEWVDCVVYTGTDRFTKKEQVFCKKMDDFLKEFELLPPRTFESYMEDVYSQLEENTTPQYRKEYPFNVFTYRRKTIDSNLEHFKNCFKMGISAYHALTFLDGVIAGKINIIRK